MSVAEITFTVLTFHIFLAIQQQKQLNHSVMNFNLNKNGTKWNMEQPCMLWHKNLKFKISTLWANYKLKSCKEARYKICIPAHLKSFVLLWCVHSITFILSLGKWQIMKGRYGREQRKVDAIKNSVLDSTFLLAYISHYVFITQSSPL